MICGDPDIRWKERGHCSAYQVHPVEIAGFTFSKLLKECRCREGPTTQDAVDARLWGNPGTGTGLRAVPGLATSRQEVAGHFTGKAGGRESASVQHITRVLAAMSAASTQTMLGTASWLTSTCSRECWGVGYWQKYSRDTVDFREFGFQLEGTGALLCLPSTSGGDCGIHIQ